jgi:hypothetical protein
VYRKTFELSINPSICACSPGFITLKAKSNTAGAKTALWEILLQEEIQGKSAPGQTPF